MEKIANLELEDAFAWGVWQKIRLTGNREITFEEIEKFALAVTKKATEELGYRISFMFSRVLTNKFLNQYREYVTYKDTSLKLNDNITYKEALDIFSMGVIAPDLLIVMLDDKIGTQIFVDKEGVRGCGKTQHTRKNIKNHHIVNASETYDVKFHNPIEDELSL